MNFWTNEQIATLRKLWVDDGLSASRCAAAMGITRNAVIGKVHREKWPPRRARVTSPYIGGWNAERREAARLRKNEKEAKRKRRVRGPRKAPEVKLPPPFVPDPVDIAVGTWNPLPGTTPISLIDLTQSSCRWPIGDGSPFLFCGCQVAEGSSYCPTHKHIGAGQGTVAERNAVDAAKAAAKQDRRTRSWLEAA